VEDQDELTEIRLLTLKIVISKLADMASGRNISHIPYRDSELLRAYPTSL
jgi:centromeric protein E